MKKFGWHQIQSSFRAFLILIFIMRSITADLCKSPDEQKIVSALKQGVVPHGAADAGLFIQDKSASSMVECVASCCTSTTCEVMFYFNDACYLISCNQSWPAGCDPIDSDDDRFANTFLLRVRSADEVEVATSFSSAERSASVDCRTSGCAMHEECQVTSSRSSKSKHHICRCERGYLRDSITNTCEPWLSTSTVGPLESPFTKLESGNVITLAAINSTQQLIEDNASTSSPTVITAPPTTTPTSASSSASQSPVKSLVVSAGESHQIQLPVDSVTLYGYVLSQPDDADKDNYRYQWSLFAHPEGDETGEMQGVNSATLKLSKLRAGLYTFKVMVSTDGKWGEDYVNVTVNPPSRINQSPQAIAKPAIQEVNQPNDLVIDGSASTDDDKIVSYQWEMVSGKLGSQTNIDASDLDKPMLVLKGLAPGSYRFKLLVTDSDGATSSAFADATVIKETDYPPTANAGSNVIVSLPQNSVTLFGNASTDDKGIVSYEWTRTSDVKLAVDMVGVRTAFLRLDNLVVGDYTFRLKVADASGQESTADVNVFVKPEHNLPPVAKAGNDRSIWLPVDFVTLDGSNSTDDQKIDSYQWTMSSGPTSTPIENADRAVATASKLEIGEYKFKLTVKDNEGLTGSSEIAVTVKQNDNQAPISNAGGDQTVYLPVALITLNGSRSTDDRGIVSYKWTRESSSPAAGSVVSESDKKPVLQLVNLVAGHYTFRLEVADEAGITSTDTASINVKSEDYQLDLVQLLLSVDVRSFTVLNERNLENELSLLLRHNLQLGETKVVIERVAEEPISGLTLLTFYVVNELNKKQEIRPGVEVVAMLKKKLHSSSDVLDYGLISLETYVCQNNCSGHGQCNQATKRCICSGFWMENFFRANFGEQESNCDWSILYVIIVLLGIVVTIILISWGIVWLCRRRTRSKHKVKRHRYALLEDLDDVEKSSNGKLEMVPLAAKKVQGSGLLDSESNSSSEETLFVNHKKSSSNGSAVVNNNTVGSQRKPPNGVQRTVPLKISM